ncbi:putative beta-galactosidase E [Fusarium oxysporum]|uniref:Beta-galactosidase n=1 Tax=Fusarium oxysporum TaxID=5507 RepID=A0A420MA34_FUSOX|nr:putative beta-galactosidase E [Fusarium oxysporum]
MGYSGVSFYLMWGLLEGKPSHFRTDGVFALEEFFAVARQTGVYLIARPGPYINAEVSGGGFPGWLQRLEGRLRSSDPDFMIAINNYVSRIGEILSKEQITNGGPIVLFQPENEYSICVETPPDGVSTHCLDKKYMSHLIEQYRKAGIVVPMINNDAAPIGNWAPGSGLGEVDIYGFDYYPFNWGTKSCASPSNWSDVAETPFDRPLMRFDSSSPVSILEYQGGNPDPWGGPGVEMCGDMINHEFERIFYKINYGFHITIMNLYMTFGGTNWGNLGHAMGYTSYDCGAAITEDRLLRREKYGGMKLQAYFLQASPAYLAATPGNTSRGILTNSNDLATTVLTGRPTKFYIVRHADTTSSNSIPYVLTVQTSAGTLKIPQIGSSLRLDGRDSKIHVTDYNVGGINLLYSSAETFTWRKSSSRTTLILYGGAGETHEFALPASLGPHTVVEGDVKHEMRDSSMIFQWAVKPSRTVIRFDRALDVYLLWRNEAYHYWVFDLDTSSTLGRYESSSRSSLIDSSVTIKGGYLLRNASILDSVLHLTGDVNVTTVVEVISAPRGCCSTIVFNNKTVASESELRPHLKAEILYINPHVQRITFPASKWRYIDSLPEVTPSYNDLRWTLCNKTTSNNPRNLTTPTSLYASDYGYHAGSILYRGHFVATKAKTELYLETSGGNAFANAVWLNSTFLGAWRGSPGTESYKQNFSLSLKPGHPYILTVMIDHMGLDQNFFVNSESMKVPRGILNYALSGLYGIYSISWRMTGNLGGEQTQDVSRGPLNEGATFAERHGYHLPGAPVGSFETRSPIEGVPNAGIGFFATNFTLDIPDGYDVPFSIVFTNSSSCVEKSRPGNFRIQLFVNGWQFGKYVDEDALGWHG